MSSWLPQNLQKRLLLYAVQQISVLSNVDLSNLHVSLGSSSHFTFDDLDLAVEGISIPNLNVKSGTVKHLDLRLTVSGGVSIEGKGIVFELESAMSEHTFEASSFSLARSIHDLTNSIMQFPDVKSDLHLSNDAVPEANNSGIANSSGSISSSGEESEAVQTAGTLENMKNRLLNVALSKLTMEFEDIKVRFLFDDENVVEVTLGHIDLQTEASDIRKVTVQNLEVTHLTQVNSRVSPPNNTDAMSNSVLYSQTEATSLYMSAMDSLQATESDESEKGTDDVPVASILVSLDQVCISFEGLSSVDHLNIADLKIESKRLDINVESLLYLNDHVYDFVFRSVAYESRNPASEARSLTGYKRFQKEQGNLESFDLFLLHLEQIVFQLPNQRYLYLNDIKLSPGMENQRELGIDSIELQGQGFCSKSTGDSFFLGVFGSSEISVSILQSVCIELGIETLESLSALLERAQEILSLWENRTTTRKPSKPKSLAINKISFAAKPLEIGIHLNGYDIYLTTEVISSDLLSNVFETTSLKIQRRTSSGTSNLAVCEGFSVLNSKSRVQLHSFDDNLNEALLTSKFVCKVNKITVEDNYCALQHLAIELQKLEFLFNSQGRSKGKQKKKVPTRKSVRILQSSSMICRHTELATFAIVLDSLTVKVHHFIETEFGTLNLKTDHILLAAIEDGNIIAFCKGFSCTRLATSAVENIIEPIRLSDTDKPLIYLHKNNRGKIKLVCRNLSFFYYARWLDIFRGSKVGNKTAFDGTEAKSCSAEQLWEVKLIDSSVVLRPYRLKAALILVIDLMVCNGKSPGLQARSTVKSGSLLLVDDISNIKRQEKKHWESLLSFYAHQGYSAIGRFDTLSIRMSMFQGAVTLKIGSQNIGLSLCADSAHTFSQVVIDLKYPLTYSDDKKYNFNQVEFTDTFKDIDFSFFNSTHITEKKKSEVVEEEGLSHVASGSGLNSPEQGLDDSSSDFSGHSIELQEAYLDLEQQQKGGLSRETGQPIDIKIEFEAQKITIKLFDGYDWKFTRRSISRTIDQVDRELKGHDGESHSAGQLQMAVFDSIYVSANATDVVDLKKRVNDEIQGELKSPIYVKKANLHPSRRFKISIQLEKLKLNFTGYTVEEPSLSSANTSAEQLNKAELSIQRFEVIDNVPTSTWNKFLTLLRYEQWPLDRPMMHVNLATFRPMSRLAATELRLNVEIAPLRLHVDQDALDFLVKFSEFKDNRFELIDDYPDIIFIQKLTTNSVKIRLDYKPKKVDYSGLRSGHASELMNFFILDGSNITLKGVALYGINGFPELNKTLKAVWTPDITFKQLPGVLEGFAPMKSILALGSGVKALVTVPLTEYKEDRRLGRGLKKGCNVFIRTTTGDFVRLGAKLASGTQAVLENTEEFLGGDGSNGRLYKTEEPALDMHHLLEEDQLVGGSNPQVKGHRPAALVIDPSKGDEGEPKIVSLYADQPLDLHKGLEEAYLSLEKHMHVVYDVVWKTKGDLKENKAGAAAAAVSVAKVAPVAIIRPLIGATEAVAKALQGISNQFDKEQIEEIHDKYKSRSNRK